MERRRRSPRALVVAIPAAKRTAGLPLTRRPHWDWSPEGKDIIRMGCSGIALDLELVPRGHGHLRSTALPVSCLLTPCRRPLGRLSIDANSPVHVLSLVVGRRGEATSAPDRGPRRASVRHAGLWPWWDTGAESSGQSSCSRSSTQWRPRGLGRTSSSAWPILSMPTRSLDAAGDAGDTVEMSAAGSATVQEGRVRGLRCPPQGDKGSSLPADPVVRSSCLAWREEGR
jgi:hypothetical protein